MRWWAAPAIPASSTPPATWIPSPCTWCAPRPRPAAAGRAPDGRGRWDALALPGPERDSFGCGDSFVAGLTYGLGAGRDMAAAVAEGARAGADCAARSGPYG